MPEMIPDSIPSNASAGEKAIFTILQNLPDDCLVYYEPIVARKFPDFVVISPRIGILIIEVKGWYPKQILGGDSNIIQLQMRAPETSKHPMRQAREYMFALMDEARSILNAPLLLNGQGEHEGRFLFPFGNMVILNNIEKKQLENHVNGDLSILFPDLKTVYREKLEELKLLTPTALELALKSFFDPWWKFKELDDTQINLIRAIIHPEIKISPAKSKGKPAAIIPSNIVDLKVLDLEQEKMAHNIGGGHRLLWGVAGSGKTIILIARAKILSQQEGSPNILILCYNVTLGFNFMKSELANYPNIKVFHFDGWAKSLGCTRHMNQDNDSLGELLLSRLENGCEDTGRYNAIMVDEAQDFAPSWFKCILEALVDRDNDDLLITGDGNQTIINGSKSKVNWKNLGIQAQGRTKYLKINYRNTKRILELASRFSNHGNSTQDDDNGASIIPVDVSTARREGDFSPIFVECQTCKEEISTVVNQIRDLLQNKTWQGCEIPGIEASNIGILYRHCVAKDKPLINELITQLNLFTKAIWLNESSKSRERVTEPGVKIQTIHSAKGLQYAAVFVLWADLFPAPFPDTNETQERNLFYVALTRAEEYLMITSSRHSSFTKTISDYAIEQRSSHPSHSERVFEDFDDDIPF